MGGEFAWTGRDDGPGAEHARWHSRIVPDGPGAARGFAVVGFASEEGVRRNHGRPGAAQGPDALRRALASMAVHTELPLVDAGTIEVVGEDLEGAQAALGARVAGLLDRHEVVCVLGGGHESAYGSYLGRVASARCRGQRVGVLNLDAHFDLRSVAPGPQGALGTSGTPFAQMAAADAEAGREFVYAVLGIADPSNTAVLFETARSLGVRYRLDEDCSLLDLQAVLAFVDEFLAGVEAVHLSIDLDVLPAAVAPGVSAPAAFGVPVEVIAAACRRVASSGKLRLVDVVELCPPYDVDSRTARTAARLITTIYHALPVGGR